MNEVRGENLRDELLLHLSGHINSENAQQVEAAIQSITETVPSGSTIEIDAEKLEYISSAGLRVILRLRKNYPNLYITGVNSEIYEIFEMTGFTEMMRVDKAYKNISIEGAEEIGRGANGVVYRIDDDNVVKVYYDSNALDDIRKEREIARKALILGIPTAISYDIVRIGDKYGSVFELLKAVSFSKILADEPEKMDWCVKEYVDLLKQIHRTVVPKGELPDLRETVIGWAEFIQDHLPKEPAEKLLAMVKAVPYTDHMLHGDYHTKNVELVNNEVLLIDMDTLSVGDPVFELGSMFNAFVGYSEYDHNVIKEFQGLDFETGTEFWKRSLAAYVGTRDEKKLRSVEDKARIIGYTRMIRRSIRRNGLESPDSRAEIELWKSELLELLERTDTLTFTCNELEIDADRENLQKVTDFVSALLKEAGCPVKERMQINVAVEEIFVNIASYAYGSGKGPSIVRTEVSEDPIEVVITFIDKGKPFDPLDKEDPDITLSADDRPIGGLGIFMVKEMMDDIDYEYKDGKNILRLKKKIA